MGYGMVNVPNNPEIVSSTIYGFHINGYESDPSEAVTYLEDAVGMTPAYMDFTNSTFVWGSWENAFFMPRPCMLKFDGTVDYYLDPDDYSKKANGTASDVANTEYGGNAMMEWGRDGKKIWYKIVPGSDPVNCSVYIADRKIDDDYRAWSFINNEGDMVDHFYTPIYNGWKDDSDRMRSLSGQTLTASLTATQERTYCRNNNTSQSIWDTEVYCDIVLINFLLILIGKSLNTQAVFGEGVTTGSQADIVNTGTGNSYGLFWGSSNTTSVVKVFGMENWWGNVWRRFGGLINDSGTVKYKMTRTILDGTSNHDYVIGTTSSDYSGYLTGGSLPESGWIIRYIWDKNQGTPSVVGGSSTLYYSDYFYYSSGIRYAFRGGSSYYGSYCGAWCLALYGAPGVAGWGIAAAPSAKPLH